MSSKKRTNEWMRCAALKTTTTQKKRAPSPIVLLDDREGRLSTSARGFIDMVAVLSSSSSTTAASMSSFVQQQQHNATKRRACSPSSSSSCSSSATIPRCSSLTSSGIRHRARLSREKEESFLSSSRLLCSSSSHRQRERVRAERAKTKRRRNKNTIKCESETRIASVLTSLPQRLDLYFQRRSYRMLLWKIIFIFAGFYLASVLTLSFGALAINDVVAGALCMFVYEIITRWYYKTNRPGRRLEFVNCFKLGLAYSLIADAFKLGS